MLQPTCRTYLPRYLPMTPTQSLHRAVLPSSKRYCKNRQYPCSIRVDIHLRIVLVPIRVSIIILSTVHLPVTYLSTLHIIFTIVIEPPAPVRCSTPAPFVLTLASTVMVLTILQGVPLVAGLFTARLLAAWLLVDRLLATILFGRKILIVFIDLFVLICITGRLAFMQFIPVTGV